MWGRPSPASDAPWGLRALAAASTAAIRADGGDGDSWAVRAASLSGTRHRLGGSAPEDAYAWGQHGPTLVLAVADGVSNRPGSAATAAVLVEAAVGRSPEAGAGGAARAVQAANDVALEAVEGAATLVVAVLDGTGAATLARIGDSSAFVLSAGTWSEVWPADAGDDDDGPIRTATLALPAEAPAAELAEIDLEPGDVLILVTDGVADALRDGPTTVAPGLAAGLAAPPDPLELARLVDFSRQGVHDDRTLVAVWMSGRPDGNVGRTAP